MQTLTGILTSCISPPQQELAAAALDAVVPHLLPLMSTSAIRLGPGDSIKDPFKAFTIAVLTMCQQGKPHESVFLETGKQAFYRRPYWFMMALTDALEQESHPALVGAAHFGNTALLDTKPGPCLFLVRASTQALRSNLQPRASMNLLSTPKPFQSRGPSQMLYQNIESSLPSEHRIVSAFRTSNRHCLQRKWFPGIDHDNILP
jgi:hypothetical protein